MRALTFVSVSLALGACAAEPSELDRLDGLLRDTTAQCGDSLYGCFKDMVATNVVNCMNGAIVDGTRAKTSDRTQTSDGFYETRYYFTVDSKVIYFFEQDGSATSTGRSADGTSPYNAGFRVGDSCTTVLGSGMTIDVIEL